MNILASQFVDKHLTAKMKRRFFECGSWVDFWADEGREKYKVYRANFCNHRACPICKWLRKQKDAMRLLALMDFVHNDLGLELLLVTLTMPSVYEHGVEKAISQLYDGFTKLLSRKVIADICEGFIRKFEMNHDNDKKITKKKYKKKKAYYDKLGLSVGDVNPTYNMYNPHFHVIIAVKPSYFKSRKYVSREKLLEVWREAMGDDTITQVDIKRVKMAKEDETIETIADVAGLDVNKTVDGKKVKKGKKGKKGDYEVSSRNSGANELAKYGAKNTDCLANQEVFDVFYEAFRGRQLLTYGGVFRDANKKYNNGELDKYKPKDTTKYVWQILMQWLGGRDGEYIERRCKRIDEVEPKNDIALWVNKSVDEYLFFDEGCAFVEPHELLYGKAVEVEFEIEIPEGEDESAYVAQWVAHEEMANMYMRMMPWNIEEYESQRRDRALKAYLAEEQKLVLAASPSSCALRTVFARLGLYRRVLDKQLRGRPSGCVVGLGFVSNCRAWIKQINTCRVLAG